MKELSKFTEAGKGKKGLELRAVGPAPAHSASPFLVGTPPAEQKRNDRRREAGEKRAHESRRVWSSGLLCLN